MAFSNAAYYGANVIRADQPIQSRVMHSSVRKGDFLLHHVDLAKTSSSRPSNPPLAGAESNCRSLFGTPPTSLYLYFVAYLDCLYSRSSCSRIYVIQINVSHEVPMLSETIRPLKPDSPSSAMHHTGQFHWIFWPSVHGSERRPHCF
ncbi:hypothetical protein L873DRAFT_681564 [Choiromyces venosus 120613-1]|uniref:Uncharacterized protein n=1 Tax=Choiromyces venosus 120613-1 TaxID=1336337 RepID=A0A3N4ISZ1_9PEZI|nr:hypothetical protein L873DRAFT_681564 [Choiromyces venosus 120613-1]